MSTPHKEKLIRVLQLFQTTDEKTPMNAVQVSQKLEEEYGMENVHRTSIYDDVRLLQSCGYPIKQAENSHKGWYMEKYLLEEEDKLPFELSDLIGYSVLDELTGETGVVEQVDNYSGNVVLTIKIFSKEILLPVSDEYVLDISHDEKRMHVNISEEIKELY